MTAILHYETVDPEQIWESMTLWLDGVFAETYTSHRRLLDLESTLEHLDQEIMEMDRYVTGPLTPSQSVAAHGLGLRLRDIDTVMFAKWKSPAIRMSALRALQGIHERYLGPISASRRQDVVFESSRLFHNLDLGGFLEAYRVELYARWSARDPLGSSRTLSIVEGPRWVHDLYLHLTGSSLRGAKLRQHYIRTAASDWRRDRSEGHFVGDAVAKPDPDTMETALKLWAPDEERSPYCRIASAIEAARLL